MSRRQSIGEMGLRRPVEALLSGVGGLAARDAERWTFHEDGSATLHYWRTGRRYHIDVTGVCSCGEWECRHSRAFRLMRGEVG